MVKDGVQTYTREVALTNKELITLSPEDFINEWGNFLNKFFPYFRNLDENSQVLFCNKTQALLKRIDVVGIGVEVDNRMRVLLIASLTQLTFGLKKLGLYNFNEIRLYPDQFHLKKTDSYYEGITYSGKIIALSCTHFQKGILNSKDGVNLGIYHLAQALQKTVNNGVFFDTHFASYIDIWSEQIEFIFKHNTAFTKLIGPEQQANCIFPRVAEVFFEQPFEFKEASIDAYAHTCLLLNQNPLNITENYAYKHESFNRFNLIKQLPAKVRKIYRHNKWHWSYNLPIFMPILAPIGLSIMLPQTLITNISFSIAYFTISIILFIGLFKYNLKSELYSNFAGLYLFCAIGLTPILSVLLLFLNNNIIIGPTNLTVKKIKDYTYLIRESRSRNFNSSSNNYSYVGVILYYEDDFLNDYYRAREFDYESLATKTFTNFSVEYNIAKGLIGLDVVLSKKIIYTP